MGIKYNISNTNMTLEDVIGQCQANLLGNARSADIIVMTTFLSLVAFIGVAGNSIVLMVYKNQQEKQSTYHFIFIMAACDLFVCLVVIPYRISSYHVIMNIYVCKIMEGLTYFTLLFSVFMLIVIAVDRFLAVTHPINYTQFKLKAFYVSMVTGFCGVAIAVPAGVMMGQFIVIVNDKNTVLDLVYNGICHGSGQDARYISDSGRTLYSIALFVIYVVLILTVSVLYSSVFYQISKRRHMRVAMKGTLALESVQSQTDVRNNKVHPSCSSDMAVEANKASSVPDVKNTVNMAGNMASRINENQSVQHVASRRTHGRTARMLVLVTLVFVLTWFPFMLIKVQIIPNIVTIRLTFFLSSMCNPIIYSFTNPHFRFQAKKVFHSMRMPVCK